MLRTNPLPRIDNLRWLVRLARPFPTTIEEIRLIAEEEDFNESTLEFLNLFDDHEEFETQ